jgi:hypothetical protein
MNLGLGNLDDLKQFILVEALRTQTDHDAVLQAIGKGVAGMFERHCNRWFGRTAGAQDTFTADREVWYLSRSPVEVITSVSVKTTDTEGWVAQTGAVQISELDRGMIDFGGFLGDARTRVRVVYTGGFYFETLEPAAEEYPTATPEGSTALPDDLKSAWLVQCQALFEGKDHLLPKGISADGQTPIPMNLKDITLLPHVVETLRGYIRYQLT